MGSCLNSEILIQLDYTKFDEAELRLLAGAGDAMIRAEKSLAKAGHNLVERMVRADSVPTPWQHYPETDVFDYETASQYYFHAHDDLSEELSREIGHFHLFLREEALPMDAEAVRTIGTNDSCIAHVVAISMDRRGRPLELFTTNGWVTTEDFYEADDLIRALPRFGLDLTEPCLAVNHWLTAAFRFFRPQIEGLIRHRDEVLTPKAAKIGWEAALEDREMEVIGRTPVSIEKQMHEIIAALATKS